MAPVTSAVWRAARMLGGLLLAAGPAFAAEHPFRSPDVRIDGGHVSVHAERLALRELLATLERGGLARIEVQGDLSGITVSDSFEDTDVAQALRRVLSAHSHLLIDRGTSDEQRRIELILLTPRGGAGAEPVADSGRPDASGAGAQDPVAVERPGEAPPDAALADREFVEQLSDPDEEVRARVLEALKDTGDAIPADAVAQVARNDASAERRVQALELLAERVDERARGPLRRALRDSEPAVRARARELIEDWHLQE